MLGLLVQEQEFGIIERNIIPNTLAANPGVGSGVETSVPGNRAILGDKGGSVGIQLGTPGPGSPS